MRSRSIVTLAVMLMSLLASAAPAAVEPESRAAELARRYMVAARMDVQLAMMMNNMVPAFTENLARARGLRLSADQKIMIGEVAADTMVALTPKLIDAMIPVVVETYTEAELEAAIAYLETPAAQSMLQKTPALAAKVGPALAPLSPVLEAEMKARLCKELGCDAP